MPTKANGAAAWYFLTEAAERLAVSVPTVRKLADRGMLTMRRIPGARPRVLASDVEALAASCTRQKVEQAERASA